METKDIFDQILKNCLTILVTNIDIDDKYVKVSKEQINTIEYLLTQINPDTKIIIEKYRKEFIDNLYSLNKKKKKGIFGF